jgi:hypothetical protein
MKSKVPRICNVTFSVKDDAALQNVLEEFGGMGLLPHVLMTTRPPKACLPDGWKTVKQSDNGWSPGWVFERSWS